MNRSNPLPGGGPWRILDDCPSPILHNTQHAYRRQQSRKRCICPRGLAVEQERTKRSHAARDAARAARKVARGRPESKVKALPRAKLGMPQDHTVRAPDFSAGICRKPEFADIVDGSFTVEATEGGIKARQRMKDVCSFCPLVRECAEFALTAEAPAASWGGVYGGLDIWNRRGQQLLVQGDRVVRRAFSTRAYLGELVDV